MFFRSMNEPDILGWLSVRVRTRHGRPWVEIARVKEITAAIELRAWYETKGCQAKLVQL